jgi:hypothetical protein
MMEHLESLHVFFAVYHGAAPIFSRNRVNCEILFRKISDKPIDNPERNFGFAIDDFH